MSIPKVLKNFNLFVDGRGYVGRADEVSPPKLVIKTEEIRAGGMDAPAIIDVGMEKMDANFTLLEYDPEILKQFGVVSGNGVQLTLRGAMVDDETTTALVIKIQGMFTEIDMGKFKAGDKSTMQCSVACRYYCFEINGRKLIEVDVDNMTRVIDGVDKMVDIRNALGI